MIFYIGLKSSFPALQVSSFVLLLWSGEAGVSAERICLPFPRPGARDRGRINAAPVAHVYLDIFCKGTLTYDVCTWKGGVP